MFNLIPVGTRIPFMKYKVPMAVLSLVLTLAALAAIIAKGFNYGVDFAGGIEMVLGLPKGSTAEDLRTGLSKMGISNASVQNFGAEVNDRGAEYIVHFHDEAATDESIHSEIERGLSGSDKPAELMVRSYRKSGLEKAYLALNKPVSIDQLKRTLEKVDFGLAPLLEVQPFGRESQNEYQLSFKSVASLIQAGLAQNLSNTKPEDIQIHRVDFVGAKVGSDLKGGAIISILLTIILIFLFIFIRFDLVYGPGVVLAILHDVVIVAGFFAFTGYEFDLTIVAALLTLAGYSINDTIIVYDRVREVAASLRGKRFEEIVDLALNQTLSRTINTSLAVFLATLALWIWGGPVVHGFAWAFLIGIVVGTYSSIFIAAPAVIWMEKLVRGREANRKKAA